ncbi:hypothetical protein FAGKG844_530026 [Frankia sp. AgKG'84/4]
MMTYSDHPREGYRNDLTTRK